MADKAHYKELGLVNTKDIFKKAMDGGYAIPAYNFNNMEQLQGIIIGCTESKSPVILQVSGSARKYADPTFLPYMAMGAVQMAKVMGAGIPVALHLDHGDTFELARSCIDSGFSSVMLDGSHHPFEENAALTRQVVDYAHEREVTVEGELGVLAGIEDEVSHEVSHFTKPEEVEAFVEKTGVDSLAISIGTSHGAYKFKVKPGEEVPPLRFDILDEIARRVPDFPIVLHGGQLRLLRRAGRGGAFELLCVWLLLLQHDMLHGGLLRCFCARLEPCQLLLRSDEHAAGASWHGACGHVCLRL